MSSRTITTSVLQRSTVSYKLYLCYSTAINKQWSGQTGIVVNTLALHLSLRQDNDYFEKLVFFVIKHRKIKPNGKRRGGGRKKWTNLNWVNIMCNHNQLSLFLLNQFSNAVAALTQDIRSLCGCFLLLCNLCFSTCS